MSLVKFWINGIFLFKDNLSLVNDKNTSKHGIDRNAKRNCTIATNNSEGLENTHKKHLQQCQQTKHTRLMLKDAMGAKNYV
jgi:hypothetical protein